MVPVCFIDFKENQHYILQVDATFPTKLELRFDEKINQSWKHNQTDINVMQNYCSYLKHFGEYGEYNLTMVGKNICQITEIKAPIHSFLRNFLFCDIYCKI